MDKGVGIVVSFVGEGGVGRGGASGAVGKEGVRTRDGRVATPARRVLPSTLRHWSPAIHTHCSPWHSSVHAGIEAGVQRGWGRGS